MKTLKRILTFVICLIPLAFFVACDNKKPSTQKGEQITSNNYVISNTEALKLIKNSSSEIENLIKKINLNFDNINNQNYENITQNLTLILNNLYVIAPFFNVIENNLELGKIFYDQDYYYYVFARDNKSLNIFITKNDNQNLSICYNINLKINKGIIEEIKCDYINCLEQTTSEFNNKNNIFVMTANYDIKNNSFISYAGKPVNSINDSYTLLTQMLTVESFRNVRWEFTFKACFDFNSNSVDCDYENKQNEVLPNFVDILNSFDANDCYANFVLIIATDKSKMVQTQNIEFLFNYSCIEFNEKNNEFGIKESGL